MRKMQNLSAMSAIEVMDLTPNYKVIKILVHEWIKFDKSGKEICNWFILKRHKATVHGIKSKDSFQCKQCPIFLSYLATLDKQVILYHVHNKIFFFEEHNQK